ncbi:MAG: aminoacyl-tRNA hydrolase, partial [Burkholderiaceae bacterium]|nr:aminoacyl-tRNA hydrolase [Burkholderiaceae bacterium]
LVLKAQSHRTREMNRADALQRLRELVERAAQPPKPRRATRPTKASRERRLDDKGQRAQIKLGRGKNWD